MTGIQASRSSEPRLGGGLAWRIWILATIFVIYTFSFQTGYSIVNPGVQKDTGLSVSQVATIAAPGIQLHSAERM